MINNIKSINEGLTDTRSTIDGVFGQNLFSFDVMQERLPKRILQSLQKTIAEGKALDPALADVVANAMKDWAIERGATHYCHWFQPLTGLTAEKHEAFLTPNADGSILIEFSGRDLIQGEPDASSFPSGSLRESFEARGYTAWNYSSPAFVREDGKSITLFIPSAFCSYTGEALDYKTPLLRSNETINRESLRVLRALGEINAKRVTVTLGVEQEYFLIDSKYVEKRLDLMETGRTLFGTASPKGMAMDVHYFGSIHERIASFMSELNLELWKLGISAKTQHHEISPCQFELAQVFSNVDIAVDRNHLTMDMLRKVAERHNMECLLHDKPFNTLGGSGKHINWSLESDKGMNLLEPGDTPHENEIFLVFLCAVVRALDRYPELLRATVADAGNDHRMGAMEAPPAILSIFLGDQLTDILDQLANGEATHCSNGGTIRLGVNSLPPIPRDVTDRNRTSPFAFTGNKFEFRTPGSLNSVSYPATVINTIVADALSEVAEELEQADDVHACAENICRRIIKNHRRILFDGDSYCQEWVVEAGRRGLPNLPDSIDAYTAVMNNNIVDLFKRHVVLSAKEYEARIDTAFAHYAQTRLIEGRTALLMVQRQILPAAMKYAGQLAAALNAVESSRLESPVHRQELVRLLNTLDTAKQKLTELQTTIEKVQAIECSQTRATAARDQVLPLLNALREPVDTLESIVDAELWPLPTYAEMVFRL